MVDLLNIDEYCSRFILTCISWHSCELDSESFICSMSKHFCLEQGFGELCLGFFWEKSFESTVRLWMPLDWVRWVVRTELPDFLEQCSTCMIITWWFDAEMQNLDILDHFGMILDALGMAVFLTVWLNRTNDSGMDWEALSYTISNAMECNTVSFLQFSSAKWRLSRRLPLLRVTCP